MEAELLRDQARAHAAERLQEAQALRARLEELQEAERRREAETAERAVERAQVLSPPSPSSRLS